MCVLESTAEGEGGPSAPERPPEARDAREAGPDRALSPVAAEAFRRLESLYRELAAELRSRAPRCEACGRCCDFETAGHTLYASLLEVDYARHCAPQPLRTAAGTGCPWLLERRCMAREGRMLGCRTYFCDPAWAEAAGEIYERYYAGIKRIAVELGLPWAYAPAFSLLFRAGP